MRKHHKKKIYSWHSSLSYAQIKKIYNREQRWDWNKEGKSYVFEELKVAFEALYLVWSIFVGNLHTKNRRLKWVTNRDFCEILLISQMWY